MKGLIACHPPRTRAAPHPLGWGTKDLFTGTLQEHSHLIVPINEDHDHPRIDTLSRQQGAQHPGEKPRGLSTAQSQWVQATPRRGRDSLGWGMGAG